jgi:dephospho-CoA kinase
MIALATAPMADAPIIGLTGGIGSGKSTVAAILAELGAVVVDADKIGHEIYLPGTEGFDRVVSEFGAEMVAADGTIDRRRLGARVFGDPSALARLNALVHPLIGDAIRRRIQTTRAAEPSAARPIVIEAAIMLEAGWRFFDRIWVVVVSREVAIARVSAARGLTRIEVEQRIDAQMSNEERRRIADVVIENDGTPAELRAKVEAAWHELRR